jgi:hypothetical protein
MPDRVSRASFAKSSSKDVALSKAADLTLDPGEVGVSSRTAPFIISTEAVDRDGDTLALDGWDLADYKNNPVILFDHNPTCPIGKSLSVFVEDDALRAVAWFIEKDALPDNVPDIFKLIEADVLRTASVTFLPLEFTQALDRASNSPWGIPPMNFKRQKLLEWSVVSVPSNQEALRQAKSLKGVDWRGYNQWIERSLDEAAYPLAAPRVEYEKTHAVVKSFLTTAKPKVAPVAGATDNSSMKTSKAGKVLNKDNLNRLKAAMKHADTAEDCHTKALELHDKGLKHLAYCADHMKAIMDSHDSATDKDGDGDGDEGGDSGDSDNTGKKDAGQQIVDEGSGAGNGKPVGEVKPDLPDSEDYYQQYGKAAGAGKKDADVLARAKAIIRGTPAAPAAPVVEQEPYTEAELAEGLQIALERQHQKHLRTLRGQD